MNNTTLRLFAATAFCLGFLLVASAAAPAAYFVQDGTETDADGNAVETWRPMTQKEFSDYIAKNYTGNYADNAGAIEQLQKDWEDARKEWNEKHPDRQITSDEDDSNFDYGDDDSGDPDDDHGENYQLGDAEIQKLLARKDLDSKADSDDYGGIYEAAEGTKTQDGSEYNSDIQRKAIEADDDEDTTSRGCQDTSKLEDANGNMVNKTFDLLSGGVNPGSHSIDGLFGSNAKPNEDSPVLLNLPFVDETDEEARKLVGYTKTERQYSTAYGTKRIPQGWTKGRILKNGKKHNTYEIYRDVTTTVKGTIEDVDETELEPDWQELPEVPKNYLDEAPFPDFDWGYGGFRGGKSVWGGDPENGTGPVIGDLKMGKDGLSFEYENGLAGWGLANDEAGALACLFVKDNDGNWVGGKFDWISTSRRTRDFTNIYNGYNGWDLSNVPKTTTAAFVIVSKDGKWRSNVITALWER